MRTVLHFRFRIIQRDDSGYKQISYLEFPFVVMRAVKTYDEALSMIGTQRRQLRRLLSTLGINIPRALRGHRHGRRQRFDCPELTEWAWRHPEICVDNVSLGVPLADLLQAA